MNFHNLFKVSIVLGVMVMLGFAYTSHAALPAGWQVIQITGSFVEEPKISGTDVVWRASDGSDFEIFLYDAISQMTFNLSNNDWIDGGPEIDGGVVWECQVDGPGNDIEIMSTAAGQITDNWYEDMQPAVSGSNIAWEAMPGGPSTDIEIFFYDGGATTQVTDDGLDDTFPDISGWKVVWQGDDGHDTEIYCYDGLLLSTTRITDNDYDDRYPKISGSNVVWEGQVGPGGNENEIFFINVDTMNDPCRITDNLDYEDGHQISGSSIVWSVNGEIFLYNIDTDVTTQITDNGFGNHNPKIDGFNIIWTGDPGGMGNDEIFFYDGENVMRVTYDNIDDQQPDVSGSTIIWSNADGLFMATYDLDLVGNITGYIDDIKWSQPPDEIDDGIINGWDEPSWASEGFHSPIMADDWLCEDERPIKDIHWWGSFIDWNEPNLPAQMPDAFHIGIWTDVPDPNIEDPCTFSHPNDLVWQKNCDCFVWSFAGYDWDPRGIQRDEACFKFDCLLSQDEWFHQDPGGEDSNCVYWLSITAVYNNYETPPYPWGWKTRPHFFNDDAVRITNVGGSMGQWPPPVGSFWRNGEPIEYPEGVSWDLSFVLTTNRKYSPRLRWPNKGYVADLFEDNRIDFRDLAILAEHWLEEGIPWL